MLPGDGVQSLHLYGPKTGLDMLQSRAPVGAPMGAPRGQPRWAGS